MLSFMKLKYLRSTLMIKNAPCSYLCFLKTLHSMRKTITYKTTKDFFQLEHLEKQMLYLTFGLLFLLLLSVHVHGENVYHVPQLQDKTYSEHFHCKRTEKWLKKRLWCICTLS